MAQHKITFGENLSLEETIAQIGYNYATRAGSDYNQMFGTTMPSNVLAWFQLWVEKRFPEMLKEEHEAESRIENAPRKRLWRWTKSVVIFFVGTIVGAYIIRILGLC
jgi:hypothetical protein